MPQKITQQFTMTVTDPIPPPTGGIGSAKILADKADHVVTYGEVVTANVTVTGAVEVWAMPLTGRIDLAPTGGMVTFIPYISGPFAIFAKDSAGGVTVKPMSVIVKRDLSPIDPNLPPTKVTVKDGPLDDVSTWGGTLPSRDEVVEVRHSCTYSGRSLWCGRLIVTRGLTVKDGVLHTTGLRVTTEGSLTLDGRGVNKSLVMLHNRPKHANDTTDMGRDVWIEGNVTILGSPCSRGRFAVGPVRVGDTTIQLTEPAENWAVGQKLLLHDTRKLSTQATTERQEEIVVVRGVSSDRKTIHLLSPVKFDHLPIVDADGSVPFRVRVLNLIANAGFVTSDPTTTTTRSSVRIEGRGRVYLDHWLAHGTGRFKAGVGMDLNYQDRNPIGLHNLIGQDNVGPNGERFVVTNGVSLDPPPIIPIGQSQVSWGITLNNSHKGLVEGNVSFNWSGASIVLLSGNERWNKVRGNFCVSLNEVNHSELNSGPFDVAHTSAGIWSRGPLSDIDGNFASGMYRGYVVAPYMHPNHTNVKIPSYPGADPRIAGQSQTVDLRNLPLSSFDGNEAFGAVVDALEIWALGVDRHGTSPAVNQAESKVTRLRAARCRDLIYYNYMTSRLTFEDTVGREGGNGFFSSDYLASNFKLVRADLRGFMTAWTVGPVGDQSHEDCYFECFTGLDVGLVWASGWDARNLPPRHVRGKNYRWAPPANAATFPAWWGPPAAIRLNGQPTWGPGASNAWNLVVPNEIIVEGFQGNLLDKFRVYYTEQSGSSQLQQSEIFPKNPTPSNPNPPDQYRVWACPEAGLTNAQAWAKYGIAWGGSVAPTNCVSRNGIVGLVASL